jgi:Ca2+-binding EF-hand superfamily protein
MHPDFVPFDWKDTSAGAAGALASRDEMLTQPSASNRATRLMTSSWFVELDTDNDGFITGNEARDFFAKSMIPFTKLAQIWESFPKKRPGHVDEEEFAHMYEVTKKLREQ